MWHTVGQQWERGFLRGAFAPDVQEAALSIARGNGMSTFTAALAAAAVAGPLMQLRGEVIAIAALLGQARIIWSHGRHFLRPQIDAEPKRWRVLEMPTPLIEDRERGAVLMAVAAAMPFEARTARYPRQARV